MNRTVLIRNGFVMLGVLILGVVLGRHDPGTPNSRELARHLMTEEGFRQNVYEDATGNQTVGYGFNLSTGFTEPESRCVLEIRAETTLQSVGRKWGPFRRQPDHIQIALGDMAFQEGVTGLLGFHNMLDAIGHGNLARAAQEARQSAWARETPERADRVIRLLERR